MLLILITGPQGSGKTQKAQALKKALEAFAAEAIVEIIDDQPDRRPYAYANATIIVAQQKPSWIDAFPQYLHFFTA